MAAACEPGTVHVVGAGLAGLSCAVQLAAAGVAVVVHEAARFAGGRCRSYFEPALGLEIDNGNHLVLSGNRATLDYVTTIGARDRLVGPPQARFDFADLATNERWTIDINDGALPWWILSRRRRVPGTRPSDYLAGLKLLRASTGDRCGPLLGDGSALYRRLWHPVLLAALNTDPQEASARLAGAIVRESLARGGRACRPLVASPGLAAAFIDPALQWLAARGAAVHFDHRVRGLRFDGDRAVAIELAERAPLSLGAADRLVLAVPAPVAPTLVPGLVAPDAFRAIVNGHFRIAPPAGFPPLLGVIGGTTEWLFGFEGRMAVTISGADRLLDTPREALAAILWREVSALTGLAGPLPPWQIIKERRATFAALPAQEARRPPSRTRWHNLLLAGDWTATGLPATIEGAIRSGQRAAALALAPAAGGN